jgi:hypothetical protein
VNAYAVHTIDQLESQRVTLINGYRVGDLEPLEFGNVVYRG